MRPILALAACAAILAGCGDPPPPVSTASTGRAPAPENWERAPTSRLPDSTQSLQYFGQGAYGVENRSSGRSAPGALPGRGSTGRAGTSYSDVQSVR